MYYSVQGCECTTAHRTRQQELYSYSERASESLECRPSKESFRSNTLVSEHQQRPTQRHQPRKNRQTQLLDGKGYIRIEDELEEEGDDVMRINAFLVLLYNERNRETRL